MKANEQLRLDRISLGYTDNNAADYLGEMSLVSWKRLEKGDVGRIIHSDIQENISVLKMWILDLFNLYKKELIRYGDCYVPIFENTQLHKRFLTGEECLPDVEWLIEPYQQFLNMCNIMLHENVVFVMVRTNEDVDSILEWKRSSLRKIHERDK